jgi:hypothetical protein
MAQEKAIKQQYYILSESFIILIRVLFAVGKVIQGTVSRDFLLQVSCMNHLPRAPKYPSVKTKFRIFSKISGDIPDSRFHLVVMYYRRWRIFTTGDTDINVSGTDVYLPPVSTTPAVHFYC